MLSDFLSFINFHFNLFKKVISLPVKRLTGMRIDKQSIELIDDETIEFIFAETQTKLSNVFSEGDMLYSRSATIASICIASLTGILGFIITTHSNMVLNVCCVATIILLIIAISILKDNLIPQNYKGPGGEPEPMFDKRIYSHKEFEKKSKKWQIIYNQLSVYNDNISHNAVANGLRAKNIKNAMYIVYSIPAFIIIIVIISLALSFVSCQG